MRKKHRCDGSSPTRSVGATDRTIYTMDTEPCWGQSGRRSPRALPVPLLPGPLQPWRSAPSTRACHPSLHLFRRPSARARPSSGCPFSRRSGVAELPAPPAAPHWAPSPLVRAAAEPPLPPAAGRSRLLGAGMQFAEESRCHGAAVQESWAGAAQPAVSAAPASLPRGRRHLPCCLAPLP